MKRALLIALAILIAGGGVVTIAQNLNNPSNVLYVDSATGQPVAASSTNPLPVTLSGGSSAIPVTASGVGTTSAVATSLAAHATKTTYICGFSIRANATAAATANSTVAGTVSGTLNFTQWTAPLASGIGITEMVFSPCIPGSATNTFITVTSAAPGAGGVVSVAAWGYQL